MVLLFSSGGVHRSRTRLIAVLLKPRRTRSPITAFRVHTTYWPNQHPGDYQSNIRHLGPVFAEDEGEGEDPGDC